MRDAIAPHPQLFLFVVPADAGSGVGENARAVATGGAISVLRRLHALKGRPQVTTASPRVDIGALAGSLYGEATERIACTVVHTIDWLDEDGRPLNQIQKVGLVRAALVASEGLEAHFAEDLKTTLEKDGVSTWGLGDNLERWLDPAAKGGGDDV